MEHQSIQTRPTVCRIRRELFDLLLRIYKCFPRAFGCVGTCMDGPGPGTYLAYTHVLWRWIGKELQSGVRMLLIVFQCGMVIESKKIRDLLNATRQSHLPYCTSEPEAIEEPKNYRFSMNPMPALVILLLGMMMSSHHQESMIATMIHTQWGTLLMGAAFARGATYILCYLSPPTSILPGRPPTELITGFCLMAGGMVFMASVSISPATFAPY